MSAQLKAGLFAGATISLLGVEGHFLVEWLGAPLGGFVGFFLGFGQGYLLLGRAMWWAMEERLKR